MAGAPPSLSVILPNFNHAHLLPRAIKALLAQERPPDEILVIDDASTDNSRRVVEEFAARVPSVHLICNATNCGAIPALKRGLELARSRYIYLAAADDWVMPTFFKRALEKLQANPELGVFCGEAILVDGNTNRVLGVRPAVRPAYRPRSIDPMETRQLLRRSDNWILTGASVFRRDCMVSCGGLDEHLGSFADGFLARRIALTHGFYYDPHIVAAWTVFTSSYSQTTSLNTQQAQSFLHKVSARLSADPAFPEWYHAVFESRWRFATCRLALMIDPVDHTLVNLMVGRSDFDRKMLKTIWRLSNGNLARVATLGWSWLRLRPMTLTALAGTVLCRRFM